MNACCDAFTAPLVRRQNTVHKHHLALQVLMANANEAEGKKKTAASQDFAHSHMHGGVAPNGLAPMSIDPSSPSSAAASLPSEEMPWSEILDSTMMKEVRAELISKYLDQGTPLNLAEVEVDKFLSDRERSEQYLEMRAYSAAQAEAGFETIFTLIAGFAIGFVGIVGPKYFSAYKMAYPDGGGPVPFL